MKQMRLVLLLALFLLLPFGDNILLAQPADRAFLNQMKFHHQGAVEMANNILKYTKDPVLTQMAKNMVISQTKDISEINKLLNDLK